MAVSAIVSKVSLTSPPLILSSCMPSESAIDQADAMQSASRVTRRRRSPLFGRLHCAAWSRSAAAVEREEGRRPAS